LLEGACQLKTFDLAQLASREGGEYVLGMKDLHTHACYLIYGLLQPGEGERLVKPGEGHEEILCAITGPVMMNTSAGEVVLAQGHAVHIKELEYFLISNLADKPVVYVMAGGHVGSHH
jgi:hypothetical protein